MPEHIDQVTLFYRFGSALLLGLLVGLQREYASKRGNDDQRELFAGTRTYALFALLGCTAALVSTLAASPIAESMRATGTWCRLLKNTTRSTLPSGKSSASAPPSR